MKNYLAHTQFITYLVVFLIFGLGWVPSSAGIPSLPKGESLQKIAPIVSTNGRSVKLIGTAVSNNPGESAAVVTDERTGRQWLIWEGDTLGPVTIQNIQMDRVFIATSNGLSEVKLRRNILSVPEKYAVTYQANAQAIAQADAQPSKPLSNGSRSRVYKLDQEVVEAAFDNIGGTMNSIEADTGKLFNQDKGVRIASLEPNSIFADMGLRIGDLILKVNNMDVTGPGDLMSLIKDMLSVGESDLTVRRRARTYSFSLLTQ